MLKIKDNIDLKELEKFGFKEGEEYYGFNINKYDIGLIIGKTYREIQIVSGMYADDENGEKVEPMLYDLIMAGLVEKVGSDK